MIYVVIEEPLINFKNLYIILNLRDKKLYIEKLYV